MKIKDKKLLILIVCFFIIIISIFVTWKNNKPQIDLIFDTILISLSINIISSILLVYFLEERDRKRIEKEKEEKEKIIFQKLINIINEFNHTIFKMYQAAIKAKNNDGISKDLYYDMDNFYKQINKVDLYENSNVLKRTKDIRKNPQYYSWFEKYLVSLEIFFSKIKELINNYSFVLDNETIKYLSFIEHSDSILFKMKNLVIDDLNQTAITEENGKTEQWEKAIFIMSNLKYILTSISNMMNHINKKTKKETFIITRYYYHNNN